MRVALALVAACLLVALPASARPAATGADWARFGYDTAHHGSAPGSGITIANAATLVHTQIRLDGTVDSSLIYLHGVQVHGAAHDTFFFTTTYGKTEAMDANTGRILWRFTPGSYSSVKRTAQITNSTPVASTDRTAIYAAAPDGQICKLRISDGKVLWATSITFDASREKMTSSLNVSRGLVIATTGGYIGDAPSYQGHVVTMSEQTGKIAHVWNSLCSDQHTLITPSSCKSSGSAIWSRNGASVDPANGNLVVATGNAPWNGKTDWGDSVIILTPDASRMLRHYTPSNYQHLEDADADLGSTSPALLPGGYAVQGGKDGVLRLLQLHTLPGMNNRTGGEVQTLPAPGPTDVFSEPAVWNGKWVFVSTSGGTAAFLFKGGRLHPAWSNHTGGSSPALAGGLLFVAGDGQLHVYVPTSGREVATLLAGPLHWQSPIIADGRVALAEGNANDHATTGVLNLYRLP